jgi:N6-adenosine-specific RNA methylase IME4
MSSVRRAEHLEFRRRHPRDGSDQTQLMPNLHRAAHPYADLFPLLEGEALSALAADIAAHGQREPITLLGDAILDGRNRYRACEISGVEPRFRDFPGGDPLAFVLSANLTRRHLNESQRAMIAARLETVKRGAPRKDANLHLSRQKAAELLHVAPRTVAHAAVVRDQAAPEIRRAVDDGRLAVSAAAQAAKLPLGQQRQIAAQASEGNGNAARAIAKKARREAREAELGAKLTALPAKRYGVILADPEWRFEPYSRSTGMDRSPDNHYPTSPTEAIVARDIASIAADDCVLFLWATVPMLPDGLAVMGTWGFAYRSHFVWAKDRAGTGYWSRNKHELLLIGARGDIPAPAPGTQFDSLIEAPVGGHSAKPEKFLELIEAYFPSLPKIELNRRGPARPGWDAWGNEAQT